MLSRRLLKTFGQTNSYTAEKLVPGLVFHTQQAAAAIPRPRTCNMGTASLVKLNGSFPALLAGRTHWLRVGLIAKSRSLDNFFSTTLTCGHGMKPLMIRHAWLVAARLSFACWPLKPTHEVWMAFAPHLLLTCWPCSPAAHEACMDFALHISLTQDTTVHMLALPVQRFPFPH